MPILNPHFGADRAQACGGANSGHSGIGCFGSNQPADSDRQICPMKAGFGIGLSRQPIRSRTGAVVVAGRSAIKGEPHRPQNRRTFPGDDS